MGAPFDELRFIIQGDAAREQRMRHNVIYEDLVSALRQTVAGFRVPRHLSLLRVPNP
jgi:hypothetical protein